MNTPKPDFIKRIMAALVRHDKWFELQVRVDYEAISKEKSGMPAYEAAAEMIGEHLLEGLSLYVYHHHASCIVVVAVDMKSAVGSIIDHMRDEGINTTYMGSVERRKELGEWIEKRVNVRPVAGSGYYALRGSKKCT